ADQRRARFRCVMVFVRSADDPEPVVADCSWEGRIGLAPKGTGGFGYDPLFIDPASGRHSAELTPAEKNARSHRGQAALDLRDQLQRRG
ncbi:MAG: non-canonical purine NTP pyrophosphatase, partial [Gammaproteobacteria bacterium]